MVEYCSLGVSEILKLLKTSENGLSEEEAKRRLQEYGYNEIVEKEKISAIQIFLSQFKSVIIWILITATIISALLGQWVDASVILAILVLNAVLGFIQEYKAERAIEALKKLASLKARVLRDGKERIIDVKELVPGDIILLESGDKVPADARLIELYNLETQEASLTGESTPVSKGLAVLKKGTPVADMRNMVFSGTIITRGRARAVVAETGMQTQIGRIAKLIEAKKEITPLQMKLKTLGRWIAYLVIIIAAIVFVTGLFFQKLSPLSIFLVAVSLAVAAIPEGLPAVVTITLALGTERMLKRNALIRKLPSVETLGSCTVICADKTGTLTHNQMTVKKLFVNNQIIDVSGEGYSQEGDFSINGKKANPKNFELLLKIGALCNDAKITNGTIGDPTEVALLIGAAKAGLEKQTLERDFKRIDEIPFESERKIMSTIHLAGKKKIMYTKGAPEKIVGICTKIWLNGKIKKLTSNDKKKILEVNNAFADSALRVLGFAYKEVGKKSIENDMIFVGLQAMIDPPRKEVKNAIEKCKSAGIKVVMITGDHELTAKAIAKELGLYGKSMTGKELDKITPNDLKEIVEEISVYARVNPEHKIKIIDALKANGHIVAMTGDGINDAPALKKADIGIAMGVTGTDVAKESSDMILTDDNFASIVNAVEEGRGVYDNIRKFFAFLISGNIGEVAIIFFSMLLLLPLPLTAIQILLVNLVTDGLPAIALGFEPIEKGVMQQRPRSAKERIYRGMNPYILWYPAIMFVAALSIFWRVLSASNNLIKAQTAVFFTLIMFELYQAFSCRSLRYTIFKAGIFENRFLVAAVIASFAIAVAVIYVPALQPIFNTTSLDITEFLSILLVSVSGAAFIEISKAIKPRKEQFI